MKSIKYALMALALVTVGFGLGEPSAQAAFRSYSPGFCNSALNGAVWDNPSFFLFPTEAVASSGTIVFVCPILRENGTSTVGVSFAEVVVNNPSFQETDCTFYSADVFGNTVDFSSASTTNGGIQPLVFDGPNTSAGSGIYGIVCSVPEGGVILSYAVDER
jgi:hypothetical protein